MTCLKPHLTILNFLSPDHTESKLHILDITKQKSQKTRFCWWHSEIFILYSFYLDETELIANTESN